MSRTARFPIALQSGLSPGARTLSAALVALCVALSASAALAGSDYPTGLFENSPVVGPGGQGAVNPAGANPSAPAAGAEPGPAGPADPYAAEPGPAYPGRRRAALRRRRGTPRADLAHRRFLRRHRHADLRQSRGGAAGARGLRSSSATLGPAIRVEIGKIVISLPLRRRRSGRLLTGRFLRPVGRSNPETPAISKCCGDCQPAGCELEPARNRRLNRSGTGA